MSTEEKNFTLLNDSVLVEPLPVTETTEGISIPENIKERPVIGIVIAHGLHLESKNEKSSVYSSLVPGTRVLFSRFAGAVVEKDVLSKLTGKEYERDMLLLNYVDIRMMFPAQVPEDLVTGMGSQTKM
jgi:co-chaperonin GroES (HSP10)